MASHEAPRASDEVPRHCEASRSIVRLCAGCPCRAGRQTERKFSSVPTDTTSYFKQCCEYALLENDFRNQLVKLKFIIL